MENECERLEIELAEVIQENQAMEAQAVKGYTKQLGVIERLMAHLAEGAENTEKIAFLEELKAQTEEKISDELNHQQGLLSEYVEFTGIQINKD